MSWLNAALLFIFVCNLAFMVGAAFLLYRIVDAAEGSRLDLKKAVNQTIEAADKLHLVARRTINEMGLVNDAQAARERSATRGVTELADQVKSLLARLQSESVKLGAAGDADAAGLQFSVDQRAKLRAELNAATAKTHQLQEEISQTQYRLKEAMAANREMRQEVSEVAGVKQSVLDQLLLRAEELQTQLQLAQERATAAELLAQTHAEKLDDITEQLNAQHSEVGDAAVDQSGLIQSQQDQIDMLAAREKSLMGRMDQMEKAFDRTQTEKTFIEERFLQLDAAKQVTRPAV